MPSKLAFMKSNPSMDMYQKAVSPYQTISHLILLFVLLPGLLAGADDENGTLYSFFELLDTQGNVINCGVGEYKKTMVKVGTDVVFSETLKIHLDDGKIQISDICTGDASGNLLNETTFKSTNGISDMKIDLKWSDDVYRYSIKFIDKPFSSGIANPSFRPIQNWKKYERLASIDKGESFTAYDFDSDTKSFEKITYLSMGPSTTLWIGNKEITAKKFESRKSGKLVGETYLDIDGNPVKEITILEDGTGSIICYSSANKAALPTGMSLKTSFADSAQMLIECYYAIKETGRFDLIERSILNDLRLNQIPKDLLPMTKRIIDLCQQGRIALSSQAQIDADHKSSVNNLVASTGLKIGAALATEDPVSMIWAVAGGFSKYGKMTREHDARVQSVLTQFDYRIKTDMYDLQNRISEFSSKYEVDESSLITYDLLTEIEKKMPAFKANPKLILPYRQRYPHYGKFDLLFVQCAYMYSNDENFNEIKSLMWDIGIASLDKVNKSTKVDNDKLNIAAILGDFICVRLLHGLIPDKEWAIKALDALADYGMKNNGQNIPAFRFIRGAANYYAIHNKVEISAKGSWTDDISFDYASDRSECRSTRPIWIAAILSSEENPNKKDIESWLNVGFASGITNPKFVELVKLVPQSKGGSEIISNYLIPKWSWTITWGSFNDDINFVNNSPFPLTNIKFSPTITRTKDKKVVFSQILTIRELAPGETHKFENVMSISNGSDTTVTGNAIMSCDQTPQGK